MQACLLAALCKRLSFLSAIMVVFSAFLLAQTGQIPPNPAVAAPPEAVPAATVPPASSPVAPPPAAQPAAPPAAAEASPLASNAGWIELALPAIKTIGGVGMIVSLILVGFILFRKFAPQYAGKNSGERCLRLIETLPMGEKRNIVLVQAGTRKLLLASTPGQISFLTALADTPGGVSLHAGASAEDETSAVAAGNFRNLYEREKKSIAAYPAARPAIPPDVRGKMQELRKALEG